MSPCESNIYKLETYYAITIDPIHVGVGGTRLERVDLSIVRILLQDFRKYRGQV